jgi:hypothetical protein
MMAYHIYGLAVDSAIPLSCPRMRVSRRPPDVRLRAGSADRFERARRLANVSSAREPWFQCRTLPNGAVYLRWAGLFEFLISPDTRQIDYRPSAGASFESLQAYLLGQVLSFALLSRGCEPLHATAVVINGAAVGFLGDCGYGKSTLGAGFIARGFPVLTDDLLALDQRNGTWIAHAGPPRLKVFPSIARALLATRTAPRLNPGTAKLVLPLEPAARIEHAVPLRALYVLPDPGQARLRHRVSITPAAPQEAFISVTASAFNLIRTDRARMQHHFATTTRLVREVPIRRLMYPRRLSALDKVCGAIVADVRSLMRQG